MKKENAAHRMSALHAEMVADSAPVTVFVVGILHSPWPTAVLHTPNLREDWWTGVHDQHVLRCWWKERRYFFLFLKKNCKQEGALTQGA